jgi:ArsR family transcriptional regulator
MKYDKKIELEANFLAVLAQPTRLKILYFLKDGEKCVCEINPYMQEDSSLISRHLVKMREAGILNSRKRGVWIHYSIKEPRVFQVLQLVDEMLRNNIAEQSKTLV